MSAHRQAWDLIPWVVNGRASADQRALVDAHLCECRDCRDELAFQQQVQQALAQEHPATPPPSLDRLWSRIDAGQPPRRAVASASVVRWLAVAMVIEAIALAALSFDAWLDDDNAPYQTLSMPIAVPPGATIRMVPASELPMSALQQLLDDEGLQIVGGPTEAGVYSLAPRDRDEVAETAVVVQHLRANPGVRFAEPVTSGKRRSEPHR